MGRFDYILFFSVLILCAIGIMLIYGATYNSKYPWEKNLYKRQITYCIVGLVLLFIFWRLPMRLHYAVAYLYYIVILLILAGLFLFGGEGVKRWVDLGFFQFQPSEFAKLVIIFVISRYLMDTRTETSSFPRIALLGLLILFPFLFIIGQPDLGTGMVFIVLLYSLLFWSDIKFPLFLILLSPIINVVFTVHWVSWALFFIAFSLFVLLSRVRFPIAIGAILGNLALGVAAPFFWRQLKDYQQERILVFLDPSRDPFGVGYQVLQSKITVGSGKMFGKGFLGGTQTNLAFLPVRHTDFIFAVLGEEFGFLGILLVLGLYFIVIYRAFRIARDAKGHFPRFVAAGLGTLLLFQVAVNVGMVVGLLPVTGLPLPFLSFGGSSVAIFMISTGLLLNIHSNKGEFV